MSKQIFKVISGPIRCCHYFGGYMGPGSKEDYSNILNFRRKQTHNDHIDYADLNSDEDQGMKKYLQQLSNGQLVSETEEITKELSKENIGPKILKKSVLVLSEIKSRIGQESYEISADLLKMINKISKVISSYSTSND